jgi:tyrosine-specific transport protein
LLIIGTSVGAGMLGLPIAAAQLGFTGSIIMLCTCWLIMLAGAFLILEVCLWMPQNTNLISMAKATIGPFGQLVAWTSYLLLLYSLLCAYIAGGSDLLHNALLLVGVHLPSGLTSFIFTLALGSVVYLGTSSVDKTNRVFMIIKFSTYFIVIFLLLPFISFTYLAAGNMYYLTSISAISVSTAAFGWAILIPTLRVYFDGDIKKLKLAIVLGSIAPLICYIIWDAVIMGVLPLSGDNSLGYISHSSNSTSNLVDTLSSTVHAKTITVFIKLFTSVCVLTSFLGVSLCLTDFFSDGLKLEKKGRNKFLIHSLTFIPALSIVMFFPNIFIKALEYAGINAAILLILLPAWMTWKGRYHREMTSEFRVPAGKFVLFILILFSITLMLKDMIS